MKILLDTHMIIWALTNDPQLSYKARKMISLRWMSFWMLSAAVQFLFGK